jgi:PDZ domain-containing protein
MSGRNAGDPRFLEVGSLDQPCPARSFARRRRLRMRGRNARAATAPAGFARIILTDLGTVKRPAAAAVPACPVHPAMCPMKTIPLDYRKDFEETRASSTMTCDAPAAVPVVVLFCVSVTWARLELGTCRPDRRGSDHPSGACPVVASRLGEFDAFGAYPSAGRLGSVRIVPELIRNGRVPTPGIGIVAANEAIAARLGADGVVVVRTVPGSPAERAGLRGLDAKSGSLGDVIVAVDGHPVRNLTELTDQLEQIGVGKTVELSIKRDGGTKSVQIQVADISRQSS